MTIDAEFQPPPLPQPNKVMAIVDRSGILTEHGLQLLQKYRAHNNAGNRIIPCAAVTASNFITLTPCSAHPLIDGYSCYDCFPFVADASTTGSVTATVALGAGDGELPTIKVYKTNGSAQAGNGDITSGLFYLAFFVDTLDSGNGGFVLK